MCISLNLSKVPTATISFPLRPIVFNVIVRFRRYSGTVFLYGPVFHKIRATAL